MHHHESLAERFEGHRGHLTAVAYRMLGSRGEAEDAVQEAWLRLCRADPSDIANLKGWLTTVVSRVCLDLLRARRSRREESLEARVPELAVSRAEGSDPEHEVVRADAVGQALLVLLDTLTPAERVAFVLHDMFDLPFDEIAPIVGRSPVATRQLASRARRRVRGAEVPEAERGRQCAFVEAFLAAARSGDLVALLAVLDPDVVLRADATAVQWSVTGRAAGVPPLAPAIRGANAVAQTLAGSLRIAQPAVINGGAGLVWAPGGQPRAVMRFTVRRGMIVEIEVIAEPERVRQLDLAVAPP